MQSRQAGTLLSAFADYSGKLAAAQSVFPASRDHDRDAVLKFHFARRSVCRLSPVTMQDTTTTKSCALADELPEDMFPYVPPQIAVHGFRRLTASQPKLLSQLCFLLAPQRALTL